MVNLLGSGLVIFVEGISPDPLSRKGDGDSPDPMFWPLQEVYIKRKFNHNRRDSFIFTKFQVQLNPVATLLYIYGQLEV